MSLQEQLNQAIKARDAYEIDPDTQIEAYESMLDDCNPEVNVCGYRYSPSHALKELDETAYRCGLNDYVDSLDIEDDEGWKDLNEVVEGIESQIEEQESGA